MESSTKLIAVDPNVERGADTLARDCLRVQAGERVHVMTFQADALTDLVCAAIERAGGVLARLALDPHARETSPARVAAQLSSYLAGATASVFLSRGKPPGPVSYGVVTAIEAARTRHLHMPGCEARTLAQSIRAAPEVLAVINDRLAKALAPPSTVLASTDAGTALEVQLAAQYPLHQASGRPAQGTWDNLPSGFVCVHPAHVSGTFVADRAVLGTGTDVDRAVLRRHPAKLTLAHGRVTAVESGAPEVAAAVEKYLASHPHAARIGLVTFPTNYLIRSEIGHEMQDMLLPGLVLCAGFSGASFSRAPYDAPVQLRFSARRATVEVGGSALVNQGRFTDALVEGIDPFR